MINIRTLVQTVLMGSAVEFECLAIGDPKPHITWSKVGGRLRPDLVISGGTVKIERVEQSDAGQYRCTATNDVGTVQSHVILHVQCKQRGPGDVGGCTVARPKGLKSAIPSCSCPPDCRPAGDEGGGRGVHSRVPLPGYWLPHPGDQVDQGKCTTSERRCQQGLSPGQMGTGWAQEQGVGERWRVEGAGFVETR